MSASIAQINTFSTQTACVAELKKGLPIMGSLIEEPSGHQILGFEIPPYITTTWGVILILAVLAYFLTRNLKMFQISRRQAFAEWIVGGLLKIVTETMGSEKKAKRYLPALGSFFIVILMCNYSGLIPGSGIITGFQAPTSIMTGTLGLALCAFGLSIYYGIRAKGTGYFKHFIQPYFFILPLNLLDEIVKPLSLSLRLYGSVFAEEVILISVYNIFPYGAPIVFYFISLFFGALQAFIFTLLSTTYIASATE